MVTPEAHQRKCERMARRMVQLAAAGAGVRLGKRTSNLFRHRVAQGGQLLAARDLNGVLAIDAEQRTADVEGMAPYEAVVRETLRHGLLPAVTPQLKSITVGGAVSGVGIESSSFRYGLVHETIEEMDVLLGDGTVVTCSRQNHADLFYGFPNSYGTLGYALRLRLRLIPAKPFLRLRHTRFEDAAGFFAEIESAARDPAVDFLDATVFGSGEIYMTTAQFADSAPRTSNYRWMNVYYRSIAARAEDWLTTPDYIWRWDTDWFWCSKNLHAQHPLVRLLATPLTLNSRTYQYLMRLGRRWLPDRGGTESVIQDVDIPIGSAQEFLEFLFSELRILPIWVCPFRAGIERFELYYLPPGSLYINFGFWDVLTSKHESGYYNRLVEEKLVELGGKKGLYSSVFFDQDTFWSLYNRAAYQRLKATYDRGGVLPGLYEKCVRS